MSIEADTKAGDKTSPAPKMLELYGNTNPDGHSDAVITVRWCGSPALIAELKKEQVTKPYVLLVVRPFTWVQESGKRFKQYHGQSLRRLVPLTSELAYISLSRPGLNEIMATVVYNKHGYGHLLELNPLFLSGGPFSYSTHIFDWGNPNGRPEDLLTKVRRTTRSSSEYTARIVTAATDTIDVEVPKELFAKEYPNWVKAFVGKFFTKPAVDQCHMRRRFLWSMAFALPYFIFAYFARLVQLGVGGWLGLRKMHVRSFFHPLKYGFNDVTTDQDKPIWFFKDDGTPRPFWAMCLNPVTPVVLGLILWGIGTIHMTRNGEIVGIIGWDWWQYFVLAAVLHVGLACVALVLLGVLVVVSFVVGMSLTAALKRQASRRLEKHRALAKQQREERKQADLKALERELTGMACQPTPSMVSLDALPKEKRTLRLYLQDTKRKVCRPIAR